MQTHYAHGRAVMVRKVWQLYLIHNSLADLWYVGQTSNGISRIRSHLRPATANPILYADYLRHGVEAFSYRFLDVRYPTQEAATLAELIEVVRRDTVFPRGYNRSIDTAPFMSVKTWDKLRDLAKQGRFTDTGVMIPLATVLP